MKNVIRENFKRNDKINTLLNIVVCLSIILVSKFNIIVILLTFIGYDAISVLINKAVLRLQINKIKDIDELKEEKESIEAKYNNSSQQEREYLREAFTRIDNKLNEELEKAKKEMEEIDEAAKMKQKGKKQYDSFKNGVILLETYKEEHHITSIKKYNALLKSVHELDEAIQLNMSGVIFVDSTFLIYTKELLNLLTSYEASSDDVKQDYKEKIKTLLDAFIEYVNRTNEKVKTYNKENIDISYNVLINELNKANS